MTVELTDEEAMRIANLLAKTVKDPPPPPNTADPDAQEWCVELQRRAEE